MSGFGAISVAQLRGIMDSPMGVDVYINDHRRRALLTCEERQADDGSGFAASVFVTELTIIASDWPDVRVDMRVDVGPQRATWAMLPTRSKCTAYVVRRVSRADDTGAQTLTLAEVNR